MNEPAWNEKGDPVNLAAAVMDALEWLEEIESMLPIRNYIHKPAHVEKFKRCVAELRKQLEQAGE